MKPRDYQVAASTAIDAEYARGVRSTVLLLPTGCGKTVCFAHEAGKYRSAGRTLVVAHRDELLRQAADKIRAVTGINPEVEKAEQRAQADADHYLASPFIVASVQTLTSGPPERRRMTRFDPDGFALVIVDEGHRAAAATYREVFAHFGRNPRCRFLLVTATGDRADGQGLGVVAESVAYEMSLPDAVRGGWLVPVRQLSVVVEGLDFSKCRTTAGDLNQEDLEAAMEFESVLHPIVHASIELAGGLEQGTLKHLRDDHSRDKQLTTLLDGRRLRQTLVFAPSVALAERMADIFGRWLPGSARCVHGETDKVQRRAWLDGFRAAEYPVLVNVGIATEGFDAPATEIVVMGRPTKSRVLATQMVGRGTRPCEAVASALGDLPDAATRLAAIASSPKPHMVVLDFVGNSGRHRLVSAVDVLAGKECDPNVLDRAGQIVQAGDADDVQQALEQAEAEADAQREAARREAERAADDADRAEAERQAKAAKYAGIVGTTDYHAAELAGVSADGEDFGDAVGHDHVTPAPKKGGATDPQIELLVRLGVSREFATGCTKRQAGAIIDQKQAKRPVTDGQRKYLRRIDYTEAQIDGMSFRQASDAIEASRKGAA